MPDQDPISGTIERCRVVWAFAEIPGGRIDEMAAELESHLRERVGDGGAVEDVVGDDPTTFAEQWAAEVQPVDSWARTVLRWTILPVTAVAAYFLAQHAVTLVRGEGPDLSLEYSSIWTLGVVVIGCLAIVQFSGLRRLFVSVLLARSILRVFVAASFLGLGVILVLVLITFAGNLITAPLGEDDALTWPWPVTVGLVGLAVVLSWLDYRTRGPRVME